MEVVEVFGFRVFSDDLSAISLSRPAKVLSTISPNSYGISTKDDAFRASLQGADYLVLDGVYFALAAVVTRGKNIRKNQGPEVFRHFMERMDRENGRVFFMGSTPQVLEKMKDRAARTYPNISVGVHSPPYKPAFSEEDNRVIVDEVNAFKPDIVFVGLTCPKQEKWSFMIRDRLDTKLICSIGAVFQWFAGEEKPIKPIWWKLRLAWLKRTIDRPEILKRYPDIFIFFWHLLLVFLRIRKIPNGK
jgi:N-acetylglucosaminyldiphosphoundecaprenol N-acetyl-beta-D-mannosaminyltransferase